MYATATDTPCLSIEVARTQRCSQPLHCNTNLPFTFFYFPILVPVVVIEELVRIINHPELDHPIRGELAEQYKTDRAAFDKAVIEHIKKYAK